MGDVVLDPVKGAVWVTTGDQDAHIALEKKREEKSVNDTMALLLATESRRVQSTVPFKPELPAQRRFVPPPTWPGGNSQPSTVQRVIDRFSV